MEQRDFVVAAVFAAIILGSGFAQAATYQLTCANSVADNLQGALNGTVEWTNPISDHPVAPGDLVELTNICQGDVVISAATSGITITNRNHNTFGISNNDGINGQLEVKNAQLNADGLVLEAGVGTDSMTNGEFADVYVHDGGSIRMNDVQIESAPLIGLYLLRGGSAQLVGGTGIQNAGSLNTANKNDGIRAEQSSLRFQGGVTVAGGNGVKIQQGSNASFNVNNGGTNTATIVCTNTANNPMAHVSNPADVSSVTTYTLNDVLNGVSGAGHPGQTNACLNF